MLGQLASLCLPELDGKAKSTPQTHTRQLACTSGIHLLYIL